MKSEIHRSLKKTSLVAMTLLILSSCAQLRYYPGAIGFSGLDFRSYTEQGFFFTPYSYNGPFESVGLITVSISPQSFVNDAEGGKFVKSKTDYEIITTLTGQYPILVERLDQQQFLKLMYDRATALGADAVVDLTLTTTLEQRDFGTVYNYTISGYAIKRK